MAPAQSVSGTDSCRTVIEKSWFSPDLNFGVDKARHFNASLISALLYQKSMEQNCPELAKPEFVFGFSLSLGLLKEFYDLRIKKSSVSAGDLVADLAGTGCALIIGNLR
jgi:uncharacterized protein YfiM (DUF2279 family)